MTLMKINLIPLIFIFSTLSCLPINYDFKENPVYILKEALESLEKRDSEQFLKISGKEALCLYGNDSGLSHLAENFPYSEHDLKLGHGLIYSQFNTPPKFVGHWSYKSERHLILVSDRDDKKIMDVVVDCEFGNEGEKLKESDQKNERKYVIKKCRLTKIIPATFKTLGLPKKCESLKVHIGL